ncbi:MAG: hypothetical protein IK066_09460 [Kiritimatiellae bacterium]|nr:hypothetical protein [Kiritimatiellia bacterium]
MAKWMYMLAAVAAVAAFSGGCDRVKESRERAHEERERAEAAAAVEPGRMALERVGGGTLDTSSLGPAWLLLAHRSDDLACRDAMAAEWGDLAREAEAAGVRVAGLYTDWIAGENEAARDAGALAAAQSAAYPVCVATRAELDALTALAPMAVNPTAYLFSSDGTLRRATGGFAPIAHHLADLAAVARGEEPPEHPAQGVLPEENEP